MRRGKRNRLPVVRIGLLGLLTALAVAPAAGETAEGPLVSFDGDGYADLAVGVPREDVVGDVVNVVDAGAVNELHGSAGGLSASDDQLWHQDTGRPGVADFAETSDDFGHALAAGNFDGDGAVDLAVGVHWEDVNSTAHGTVLNAGAVNVLYGGTDGLTASGEPIWHQDQPGVMGTLGAYDEFGRALAAGDFDGDGYDDLAIGVPYDDVESEAYGTVSNAGAVNVLYGSVDGLTASGEPIWDQEQPGVEGIAEGSDYFGRALAAGDFDGDGYDDLAIGVPYDNVESEAYGTVSSAGAVNVLYGSADGLVGTGEALWSQDQPDVGGAPEEDDHFGSALATGDFDGNGFDDLAVGVPGEDIGTTLGAGAVNILYGSADGLTARGEAPWYQGQPGVEDTPEAGDEFGFALAAGHFDGDDYDDLAIGVPYEEVDAEASAGAVNVLFGSSEGLTGTGERLWHQNAPGVESSAEAFDDFGYALAAGDLDGDGFDDVAIGAPGEDVETTVDGGGVNVLYGSATGLSGRSEAVWHQGRADVLDNAEVGDSFGFSLAVGEWHASPPPMPDNVEASDGTSNSEIRITWDGVSRATYYSIWWSDSPTGWTWFLDTTTNSSYDHTSVPPCTLNYYWISACNDNGCSRLTGPDSGYQAMVPPINLDASDGTYTDKVRITFDVTSGAESYGFFRATSLAGERLLLSPGSSETTFEDTTASPGRVYYYWVLASEGFCIEWSGYDTGHRAISPPTNVAASDGTESDRVHVTWDAATGATAYGIYRATSLTGARAEVGTTADTTYTDTAADPGTLYFYWVKGCNGPRCSDASTPDSGYCGEATTRLVFLPLVLRR